MPVILKALEENRHDFIDSASMMMNLVKRNCISLMVRLRNIKIRTRKIFIIAARAILQAKGKTHRSWESNDTGVIGRMENCIDRLFGCKCIIYGIFST